MWIAISMCPESLLRLLSHRSGCESTAPLYHCRIDGPKSSCEKKSDENNEKERSKEEEEEEKKKEAIAQEIAAKSENISFRNL